MKHATTVVPAVQRIPAPAHAMIPAWKRALDIGVVVAALPVLVPVGAIIAAVIKCVSWGPVLFRQERIGLLGKPFVCFKFRTMRVDAGASVHEGHLEKLIASGRPMVKMDAMGDPRLIPFGSILRASGLDELPQFINVFRGEMSIVGPRPCMEYEYSKYQPRQKARFNSLPGITGLWQVSGKNNTTFEQMIAMDIAYAEMKSPGLDIKIMLKTIPTLVQQLVEARRRRAAAASRISQE